MSFRVYVEKQFNFAGDLTVYLIEQYGSVNLMHTHDGRRVQLGESAVIYDRTNDYFCRLPGGSEHALLGELSRTLGAVEHPEQLRRDYDHLRIRHDKLVDHLMDISLARIIQATGSK